MTGRSRKLYRMVVKTKLNRLLSLRFHSTGILFLRHKILTSFINFIRLQPKSPLFRRSTRRCGNICIGGSRGACRAHAPPTGPNSFVFAYIFAKKCPCRRSTPPLREILDPPLICMEIWCRPF